MYTRYITKKNDELYHHGIKGMKWGVRRYQNYDGSYTKRGLERYNKAEQSYNEASKRLSSAKSAYKSGSGSKTAVKLAKSEVKTAKKQLSKSYDQLKQDKLADQGKVLYAKGKTITAGNRNNAIFQTATVVGSVAANSVLRDLGNKKIASIASVTIAVGGTAANAVMAATTASNNRKLRAYYAHGGSRKESTSSANTKKSASISSNKKTVTKKFNDITDQDWDDADEIYLD